MHGLRQSGSREVAITVGGMTELPVTLSVAGGKEVVEVTSQAELVELHAAPLPTRWTAPH